MDAATRIEYVPAAVGVPQMRPVDVLAPVMPGAMLHCAVAVLAAEYLVGELVARIWYSNGTPTCALAVSALLMTGCPDWASAEGDT